ncbi:hypothetical protein HPB50_014403 [Hyalomma asiaticum]|uniref:Uncharacterized protein n=1 Tax=Hyalomma asiaticum TaxID=266040 RepID=A0ACB7TGI3_HYAAI|nr:hypothetical protein HPB50_014403 [Hyalomma asiaticum]
MTVASKTCTIVWKAASHGSIRIFHMARLLFMTVGPHWYWTDQEVCTVTWEVGLASRPDAFHLDTYNRLYTSPGSTCNAYVPVATTGKAATAIRAVTVHSALKITLKKDDGGLRHSDLNPYRCAFRDVKAILVDEGEVKPGTIVQDGRSGLFVNCEDGYHFRDERLRHSKQLTLHCIKGTWYPPAPWCEKRDCATPSRSAVRFKGGCSQGCLTPCAPCWRWQEPAQLEPEGSSIDLQGGGWKGLVVWGETPS